MVKLTIQDIYLTICFCSVEVNKRLTQHVITGKQFNNILFYLFVS